MTIKFNQTKVYVVLVFTFLLSGCATTLSPEQLSEITDDKLAAKYYYNTVLMSSYGGSDEVRKQLRQELEKRKLVDDIRWPLIDRKIVKVGMNHIEVLASIGDPKYKNKEADHEKWRYSSSFYNPMTPAMGPIEYSHMTLFIRDNKLFRLDPQTEKIMNSAIAKFKSDSASGQLRDLANVDKHDEKTISFGSASCGKPYKLKKDCSFVSGAKRKIKIGATKAKIAGSKDGTKIMVMSPLSLFADWDDKMTDGALNAYDKIEIVLKKSNIKYQDTTAVVRKGIVFGYYIALDGDGYSILEKYSVKKF